MQFVINENGHYFKVLDGVEFDPDSLELPHQTFDTEHNMLRNVMATHNLEYDEVEGTTMVIGVNNHGEATCSDCHGNVEQIPGTVESFIDRYLL